MTTIIITIGLGVAAVVYFISIGKKLQSVSGLTSALGIMGKINKGKKEIDERFKEELKDVKRDNPRQFFND